ncbi:unnamed protein product [Nezara viridula]|nr:unnamed protein product [Nezara viridula]
MEQMGLLNLKTMKVEKITPPSVDGITWDCLYHTCSLLSDSKNETSFLLYGGRTSPVNQVNKSGFVITIKKDGEDVRISGRKVEHNESYPEGRRRHCALNVNGGVFLCGGLSVEKGVLLKVLDDSWLFTHDEQWVKLDSKMSPRFSHSVTGHCNQIFITGGLSQEFEPLNDLWSFDISANVWTYYDLNILPRYSHTSHYINDWIVLIGGVNYLSENQPGICIINLKDKIYKEFKLPESKETSPVMLHNHCSILLSDLNSVYVIGGGGNCFSFGTSFNEYLILFHCNKILNR